MHTPTPAEIIRYEREKWAKSSRAFKWVVRVLIGGPLILAVIVLVLMRSPVVGWIVGSQIRQQTGGELSAGSMVIGVDGRLLARDVVLRVPNLDGPAAELIRAERAVVDIDWSGLLSGGPRIVAVRLNHPVFRLSQSADDASLNLGQLRFSGGGAGAGTPGPGSLAERPPQIDVFDGSVEFAEHSARHGTFDSLQSIRVAGSITPIDDTGSVYTVRMQEIGRAPTLSGSPRGMILDGRLDLAARKYRLELLNLPLESFTPEGVPSAYREIWRRLRIQGRVSQTEFVYEAPSGVRLDLRLDRVSLDLPLEGRTEAGAVSDNLGVSEVSGVISLSPQGLSADVTGVLEGQAEPSRVLFETRGLSVNSALRLEITARDLQVDKDPAFYAFVSPQVKRYFEMFSGPTAKFDARMVILRDAPTGDQPAPVRVTDGRLVFRDGTAAYDGFPYPFHSMSGIAEFGDDKLIMREFRGVGPTGATMSGSARIEPLDKTAEAEVLVSARSVPIDEHLLAAMPEADRRVLSEVFSREQYDRLIEQGHVMTTEQRTGLEMRLDHEMHRLDAMLPESPVGSERAADVLAAVADLQRRLETPAFDLGGSADIDVRVFTPRGEQSPWTVTVSVLLPEAGVLPEPFPYPIRARNIRALVEDDRIALLEGAYEGLQGGSADLSAVIERSGGRNGGAKPNIRVSARDLPVNELLIQAIPEEHAGDSSGAGSAALVGPPTRPLSAQEICRALVIEGTIDCVAEITEETGPRAASGSDNERIRHDVTVDLTGITLGSRWRPGDRTLRLEDLDGEMNVNPERILIEGLKGELWERAVADPEDRRRAAKLEFSLRAALADEPKDPSGQSEPRRAVVGLVADDLTLDSPLEVLVSAFSVEAGTLVNNIRAELKPSGTLDVGIQLRRLIGAANATTKQTEGQSSVITIHEARDVALGFLDGRLGFDLPAGGATLTQDDDGLIVDFDHLEAMLRFDGSPCGRLEGDGTLALTPSLGLRAPASATGRLTGLRTESSLAAALLRAAIGRERADRWRQAGVTGELAIDAQVATDPATAMPEISAAARLVSLGLDAEFDGDALEGSTTSGRVTLRASSTARDGAAPGGESRWSLAGEIEELGIQGPPIAAAEGGSASEPFMVRADGTWSFDADRGFTLRATAEASANSLRPGHKRLLPFEVKEAISSIDLQVDGPWTLGPARIEIDSPPRSSADRPPSPGVDGSASPSEPREAGSAVVAFHAPVTFTAAKLEPGIKVELSRGDMVIDIRTDRAGPDRGPIRLELDDLDAHLQGVHVRDASAVLESGIPVGDGSGTRTAIRSVSGSCHGGRVWGSGTVSGGPERSEDAGIAEGAGGDGAFYRMDFMAAGVAFAPLLAELSASADAKALPTAKPPEPAGESVLPDPDSSRGVMDAWLSIAGRAGMPATRVGRGSLRVTSGQVLRLPVVYELMQVSNLLLPSGDQLDYLQAVCHVEGERVHFPQIALLSDSISVIGSGNIDFPDLDIDMTFNSRANTRMPLLSDLLEAMRNELVTTRMTGYVADPQISSSPFVGTRKFLSGLFESDGGEAPALSSEAIEGIRRERERVQRSIEPGTSRRPAASAER